MAKKHLVSSDSKDASSSDSDSDAPALPKSKAQPLPRLNLEQAAADATVKTARKRQATAKVQETQKNADKKKDSEIERLKKQLATAHKKHEETKALLHERDEDGTGLESEDEPDAPVQMSAFSDSFVSKGVVATTGVKPLPKKLRKSGEEIIPTPGTISGRVALRPMDPNATLDQDFPPMTGVDEEPPQSSSPRMSHHPSSSSRTSPLPSSSPRTSHHRRRIHGSAPPRHRSSSPNPRPRKRRKEAAADPPAKVAGFTDGKAPSTSRTNLKHFEESARKLIQAAMHEYEGRIWTLDAYPSTEVQAVWVQEIWDGLNAEVQERTALTERIARMIKSYASHARSSLKDSIRPLIGPTYRFNAGETQKDMDKNVVLRGKLLKHSAFHYKDPGTLSIYAGHKIILASLRAAFFKKKGSRGVLYSKYFSPISLVTLALVFTVVEFCIDEYTTGRFMQAIFDEVAHKERYESHLLALTEWSELMPPVTTALRQQLHDRCRTLAGAAPVKAPQHLTDENRARALAELQAMQVDLGLEEERQEKEQEQEQEEEDGVRGDDTPVTPELELNDGNDA